MDSKIITSLFLINNEISKQAFLIKDKSGLFFFVIGVGTVTMKTLQEWFVNISRLLSRLNLKNYFESASIIYFSI